MSYVPSKFWQRLTLHNEHWIPHSFWMVYADVGLNLYKTWMEGTYDIRKKKKSTFLCDYWTKSDGVFAEMQIISYIFLILKDIQVSSQFRKKLLILKVWLSFFSGTICRAGSTGKRTRRGVRDRSKATFYIFRLCACPLEPLNLQWYSVLKWNWESVLDH